MKKILSLLLCMSLLFSCCVIGFSATASALEASPESDFIAFDGVIEDYVGEGGVLVIPAEIDGVPTTEIATDVFLNNTDITEVYLPEGLEKLGHRAFKGCTNITKIELPYSLTLLGTEVFNGCKGITEITLPGSIEKIPYGTFCNSFALSQINISYGVKEIHTNAFGLTSFECIVFPETVNFIAAYAMQYIMRKGTIEIIICNPDLDLGRTVKGNGLYDAMMKGEWTDNIERPWNSTFGDGKAVFNVTVRKHSKIAEFVKNWKSNGLLKLGEDEGAGQNSYNVIEKDESYFKGLKENQSDFGIVATRSDLTFTSSSTGGTIGGSTNNNTQGGNTNNGGTTNNQGTTNNGGTTNNEGATNNGGTANEGTSDNGATNNSGTNTNTNTNSSNKNNGGSTTAIVEEENSQGTVLLIIGIVFGVLIIGVVVFAVIFLKKKSAAEEAAEETEEAPAEDAE